MEKFNMVPDKGTFGGSVEVVNQNFLLAQQEMEMLRNLISPETKFVTAFATAQTTSVTQVLKETGSTDTVYRVGSWDGSQYDPSVYSEYAWNGSAYIKISTKSQVGEVYDISANHADAKYSDLAAALGVDGTNIPQSLRKGGMSIKFVQSSDNKYIQYRLMSDTFNTNVANWQGVDEKPKGLSKNIASSGGCFESLTDILSLKNLSYDTSKYITTSNYAVSYPVNIKAGEKIKLTLSANGVLSGSETTPVYYNDTEASHNIGNLKDGSSLSFTASVDISNILLYIRTAAFIAAGNAVLNIEYKNKTVEEFASVNQEISIINGIIEGVYITKPVNSSGISVTFPVTISSGNKVCIGLSADGVLKDDDFVSIYYNDTDAAHSIGSIYPNKPITFTAPTDVTKIVLYIRQTAFIASGSSILKIGYKNGIVEEVANIEKHLDDVDNIIDGENITKRITTYGASVNFPCIIKQGQKVSMFLLADGVLSSDDVVAMYYNDTSHSIGSLSNGGSLEFTAPADVTQIVMYVRQQAFIAAGDATLRVGFGGLTFNVDRMSDNVQKIIALNSFGYIFNKVDISAKLSTFAAYFDNRSQFVEPFLFFTDPHLFYDTTTVTDGISDEDRQEAMSLIEKAFNMSAAKYVLCGGDWLTSHKGTKAYTCLSWIDGIMNALFQDKYYLMNGNHDNNYQAKAHYGDEGLEAIPNDVMVNLLYKRFGNNNMYYSFFGLNTRWFILDTGIDWIEEMTEYRWEQIDWLATQLLACADAHIAIGMHIIANSGDASNWQEHLAPMTTVVTQLLSAYNSKTSITLNGQTYDFSSANGTVHFIIAGHAHFDTNGVVNGIPIIVTTNVKPYYTGHNITFDLVFADYDVHKLYMTRIGVGSNREITII